jgi:hypothetical protein
MQHLWFCDGLPQSAAALNGGMAREAASNAEILTDWPPHR